MCILYHISMDDRFKSMFADAGCIPQVRLANVRRQQTTTDALASAANGARELMHEKQSEREGGREGRCTSGTKTHQRTVSSPLLSTQNIFPTFSKNLQSIRRSIA